MLKNNKECKLFTKMLGRMCTRDQPWIGYKLVKSRATH